MFLSAALGASEHERALDTLVGCPRITHEQDDLEWQGGASEAYGLSDLAIYGRRPGKIQGGRKEFPCRDAKVLRQP